MPWEEEGTVSKSKEMLVGLHKMLSGFCFKYYKQFCLSLFKLNTLEEIDMVIVIKNCHIVIKN